MISDQLETNDDLEIDGSLEDEVEQTESEEETERDDAEESEESSNDESDAVEEEVPAKRKGYVEFSTPEQKARVAQLTREKHEAARKADALQRELEQYRKPVEAPKEVPTPSADPVTDPELYTKQMREREQYIKEVTKFEAESEARAKQTQEKEQQRMGSLLETYNKNIARLKINPKVLEQAANTCESYGINKDLVEHLLEDEDGPAIVAYLGASVDDLAEVTSMKPTKAVAYIERMIRSKLKNKQTSKAPAPPTKVSGTRPKASVGNNGTVYE